MSPLSFLPGRRVGRPAARLVLAALAGLALAGLDLAGTHSGEALAIVGGREDAGALARSAVMVLSSRGGVCSGVVVARDVVLTAAHCVTGASDYRVHFRGEDGAPVLLDPSAITVHPGYDGGAIKGRRRSIDIALVRLGAPLPERFAPAEFGDFVPPAGEPLVVAGFGVAREGEDRSTGTFRVVDLALVEPYGRSSILVWAKGPNGAGAGSCNGDSGGAITALGVVVAVSTWASGQGRQGCGDISQGVLLAPQRAWIDAALARWARQAAWH